MNKLREKLAELEHDQWAHWFLYHDKKTQSFLVQSHVDAWYRRQADYQRWLHQANTPYAKLTEKEKDSDRKWADKVLAIVKKENVCIKLTDLQAFLKPPKMGQWLYYAQPHCKTMGELLTLFIKEELLNQKDVPQRKSK